MEKKPVYLVMADYENEGTDILSSVPIRVWTHKEDAWEDRDQLIPELQNNPRFCCCLIYSVFLDDEGVLPDGYVRLSSDL